MNSNRTRVLAFLLCLILVSFGAACGKKGPPTPQDQKNMFQWKNVEASLTPSMCVSLVADMSGAAQNVESFVLELEPKSDSVCVDCPFNPYEVATLTPNETVEREKSTRFLFTYCPQNKADSYRWRLVARNVFNAFPYVISPIRTLKAQPLLVE